MAKIIRKPRDFSQRALSVVQQATGQTSKRPPLNKNPMAVRRGHLGGIKGGLARKRSLSPERRKRIAKKAASTRWKQ